MVPKALALESAGHDKGVGVGQVLAIDVGGTFIKYALVDEGGVLTGKGRVPTPLEGLDDFIDTVESIYQVFHGQVEGIALSVPGVVDRDAGFMHSGGALEYNYGVPLAALLQERMPDVSVSIENDAKAAVWAEMTSGALADYQRRSGATDIDGEELFALAGHGDEDALVALRRYCSELAVQILNI